MDAQSLQNYPRLTKVMSTSFYKEVEAATLKLNKFQREPAMHYYAVFLDISSKKPEERFNAIRILNDQILFENHIRTFVGFIYSVSEYLLKTTYVYASNAGKILTQIANNHGLNIPPLQLSAIDITDNAQECIALYKDLNINQKRLNYYLGWTVKSKESKSHRVNLVTLYDFYGESFCKLIHKALSDHIIKQKSTSSVSIIRSLTTFLNGFTIIWKTESELREALKAENSSRSVMTLFDVLLAKRISMLDKYNEGRKKKITPISTIKGHFRTWSTQINYFTECFINTGIFDEPLLPFIIPKFKEELANKACISVGGNLPDQLNEGVFSNIPLEIKDDEAIEIIKDRISRDVAHVRLIAKRWHDDIHKKIERNEEYKKVGTIKFYSKKAQQNRNFNIGLNYPENTVATFYHYGHDFPNQDNYISFLGFSGEKNKAMSLLALPTTATIHALCSLLIIEHPQITPSWLNKWELINKVNDQVGFQEIGDQWIALSYKDRRGSKRSKQEVVLTNFSKKVVETLIKHTEFSRASLKKKGDDGWRYMLLKSNMSASSKVNNIGVDTVNSMHKGKNSFNNSLYVDTYDENGKTILKKNESKKLVQTIHLRPLRSLCCLLVYLETRSIKAFADALGHKEPNMNLLESYLPKPILDFYNDRWVRILQNAIMFKAMEGSELLHTALDFDEDKLAEFLANHQLKNLPSYLDDAKFSPTNEDNQRVIEKVDKVAFIISTGLLQILIAITCIIEDAKTDEKIPPILDTWYESACFILSWFDTNEKEAKYQSKIMQIDNLMHLYQSAKQNPLCVKTLKEQLCR